MNFTTQTRCPRVSTFGKIGTTFVELLVYLTVFVLFIGLVMGSFFWMRQSEGRMRHVDVLHKLRVCYSRISEKISYGTSILYPKKGVLGATQLVFRTQANELCLIFVNRQNQVVCLNVTKKIHQIPDEVEILGRDIPLLLVSRSSDSNVVLELKAIGPKKEFSLRDGIRLRNTLIFGKLP
ncbi:hypothetical protein HYY75_03910 [bacterium]|nr:hypothetical protein [bacterium]